MAGSHLSQHYSTKATPQTEPAPGKVQAQNSAGGYVFAADAWTRLDRFLILGTEGGSYYASERALTRENAESVRELIEGPEGERAVQRIAEISQSGRAPKNDPAIFALAMAAKLGRPETRRAAHDHLPAVCRIGTHLFRFAEFIELFGGWGRGTRNAVARWYTDKPADRLAYQAVKYRQRNGWSHRDLLRLAHPSPRSVDQDTLLAWIVGRDLNDAARDAVYRMAPIVEGFEQVQRATTARECAAIVRECGLTHEMIPTGFKTSAAVWEALLEKMPMGAMVRNLVNMSRSGLVGPMSDAAQTVADRLADVEAIRKARLHPIALLTAKLTYGEGRSARGRGEWQVSSQILEALEAAFYAAFEAIEPTGKRTLLALDVSGSMSSGAVGGVQGFTPALASAAMALVTARTETRYEIRGFAHDFRDLKMTARDTLESAMQKARALNFGGTDCALPMEWARKNKALVDTFVVYTDSETWAGHVHPFQALQRYRKLTGIPARLAVVGLVSNGFSIADPSDAGMMDFVGFDTAAPRLLADFSRGSF